MTLIEQRYMQQTQLINRIKVSYIAVFRMRMWIEAAMHRVEVAPFESCQLEWIAVKPIHHILTPDVTFLQHPAPPLLQQQQQEPPRSCCRNILARRVLHSRF